MVLNAFATEFPSEDVKDSRINLLKLRDQMNKTCALIFLRGLNNFITLWF